MSEQTAKEKLLEALFSTKHNPQYISMKKVDIKKAIISRLLTIKAYLCFQNIAMENLSNSCDLWSPYMESPELLHESDKFVVGTLRVNLGIAELKTRLTIVGIRNKEKLLLIDDVLSDLQTNKEVISE